MKGVGKEVVNIKVTHNKAGKVILWKHLFWGNGANNGEGAISRIPIVNPENMVV